jgi:hypothetical protein
VGKALEIVVAERPHPTMRSPKNSCSKAVVFTPEAIARCVETNNPFYFIPHVSCYKHFLCPEMLLHQCIVIFGTCLSGYALVNASRTAKHNFEAK